MLKYLRIIMSMMTDESQWWRYVRATPVLRFLPDKYYLKKWFKYRTGYELNLKNPQTFNEKLQWLKLYNKNPEYTKMVDKYEVRQYIKEKIGDEYLIPLVGGPWDRFADIDFSTLPNQFVLKCTHDSGGVAICKSKDQFDIDKVKEKFNYSLKRNFYYYGREWPYKNVKPQIIAEKYMGESDGGEVNDYKFMCFDSKVECIFTCTERFSDSGLKVTFFDTKWNKLPFERHYPSSDREIKKPARLADMIKLAEYLSQGIPFVRVDFYEIDSKIYFGEFTFFPGGGMEEFEPWEWDKKLGDYINLPVRK